MSHRIDSLEHALNERILVLDGAMGTAIQNRNLTASDFGGADLEGCNENLIFTRPDIIQSIHEDYLKSGCDIIETNTFGATELVLDEYGLSSKALELNIKAAEIARAACEKYSTPDRMRFVAGSIGPTTKAISVTGGISFNELIRQFALQAEGLILGGSDYLLIETCQDTRNIKAALFGCDIAFEKLGRKLPIAISGTIEPMGTMLAGQSIEALYASVMHRDLLYIGLNCATGPEFMTDHIRSLAEISKFRVSCVPNAGLPDENGCYLETPPMLSQVVSRFVDAGWINVIGGCCGTHSGHIHSLSDLVRGKKPRALPATEKSFLSGIDLLEVSDDIRPVLVGERTNVIGSKKFKTLICDEKFEEASEIARAQIKSGAQIVDFCLANPDRNELEDMRNFLEQTYKKVRAPIMIDSTDEKVIELSLTYCQGKAIINSINLEDGEERFEKVLPLAKKYGAALVVGTIDDDPERGMGVTRERKLEIARREYDLLTGKYGIPATDIYWDPLVFPCATGDAQYVGSAIETIEGIRLIKAAFPGTKTVLGISNISFGLPSAGREVLNSVFLYHCVNAGLDLAIVNSEKLERYASIPAEEIKLADDLLFNRTENCVADFANHFRSATSRQKGPKREDLPLEQRLSQAIVEGSKEGLHEDLKRALEKYRPLDVINGPLMKGMDEVGRLFNGNQLIVAEVLQSAEVMKAAVAYLEPYMEKAESSVRGKVLLATVKGDVHDIGKNLVEIILANNGFKVVNLGIKIPPEQLISAIREHNPDIVGLSGLLVKSAQQMIVTADDMTRAGTIPPMLLGGAALTETFVDRQVSPQYAGTVAYASDAMHGLDLAKKIVDREQFGALQLELKTKREARAAQAKILADAKALNKASSAADWADVRSSKVSVLKEIPMPSDFERHVIKNTSLDQIWPFINPLMLYGRHLGVRGGLAKKIETKDPKVLREIADTDPKALSIRDCVQTIKDRYRNSEILKPSAVYRFFGASSEGRKLNLYESAALTAQKLGQFEFPRQKSEPGLCLADYTADTKHCQTQFGRFDNIAMFVVTVGRGVREEAEKLKNAGAYLESHVLQALALETAEAYAEYIHAQIRKTWGYPDSPDTTMMDRFQAKYRGKRYSFGYPACPRLDDQEPLFKMLQAADIGVELTEGFMMDPESSVSAIVFHHPDANYFSVGQGMGDTSTADQRGFS